MTTLMLPSSSPVLNLWLLLTWSMPPISRPLEGVLLYLNHLTPHILSERLPRWSEMWIDVLSSEIDINKGENAFYFRTISRDVMAGLAAAIEAYGVGKCSHLLASAGLTRKVIILFNQLDKGKITSHLDWDKPNYRRDLYPCNSFRMNLREAFIPFLFS
ncbi:hypothetical protein Cgig2_020598 [Carnegiea gigantea]|uniref:Uncharacterized protein n=1 Tax=Carnegiea gigantea TaxID=171969 RepID=A0A9Q1JY30_9CARY|nr:hypothetical protein Cgig2_020598 [Carnegiea gigantea]